MKLLLFVVILLVFHISNAQEINGIGVIKLGKTETQILNDLKIESKHVIDGASKTMKELGKKSSKANIRIKFDPTSKLIKDMLAKSTNLDYRLQDWGIEKCTDAVLFLIPKYEVANVTV